MPKILYATVLLACVVISRPVHAQQSLVLNVGHFAVRGIDTRVADDVLLENLNLFAFDISDFNNGTVGAEWLVGLGDHFDVGVGLGFYQRTVLSVYNDFIDFDGTEIEQDFRLRVVPVTATVRVLPFGRTAVQPYFGVGLGLFNWRYSEVGEFVDFDTFDIFRDRYVAEGNDIGAIILGGVRFPVGDKFSVGGELKYQSSTGTVGIDQGFLNERIDLGGLSTQFTVGFTF